MRTSSRWPLALAISVLVVFAAIAVSVLVYALSGGTVVLIVLPLIAPGVILLLWSVGSGRRGRS